MQKPTLANAKKHFIKRLPEVISKINPSNISQEIVRLAKERLAGMTEKEHYRHEGYPIPEVDRSIEFLKYAAEFILSIQLKVCPKHALGIGVRFDTESPFPTSIQVILSDDEEPLLAFDMVKVVGYQSKKYPDKIHYTIDKKWSLREKLNHQTYTSDIHLPSIYVSDKPENLERSVNDVIKRLVTPGFEMMDVIRVRNLTTLRNIDTLDKLTEAVIKFYTDRNIRVSVPDYRSNDSCSSRSLNVDGLYDVTMYAHPVAEAVAMRLIESSLAPVVFNEHEQQRYTASLSLYASSIRTDAVTAMLDTLAKFKMEEE